MSEKQFANFKALHPADKMSAYITAKELFNMGLSHPQVVHMLTLKTDAEDAMVVTDKAFREVWDQLYIRAAQMFAENKIRSEVVEELKKGEPYPEVVDYLVDDLYNRNIDYIDSNIEAERTSRIWIYMLVFGVVQTVRFFIDPYNKYAFMVCAAVGLAGLAWGIKEIFFNKKHDALLKRHAFFEAYKTQWQKEQSETYSQRNSEEL